jgi:hypothetical protein
MGEEDKPQVINIMGVDLTPEQAAEYDRLDTQAGANTPAVIFEELGLEAAFKAYQKKRDAKLPEHLKDNELPVSVTESSGGKNRKDRSFRAAKASGWLAAKADEDPSNESTEPSRASARYDS